MHMTCDLILNDVLWAGMKITNPLNTFFSERSLAQRALSSIHTRRCERLTQSLTA